MRHTSLLLLALGLWLSAAASPVTTVPPAKDTPRAKKFNTEPPFFSAVAYGPVHPETCQNGPYNPNIRLIEMMAMLLFPIIFYAVYQCCCTGERISACCKSTRGDSAYDNQELGSQSQVMGSGDLI